MACSVGHTCAILSTGKVKCWGSNEHGELGNGRATGNLHFPPASTVGGGLAGVNAVQIAVGDWHTCVLAFDGSVRCWGYGGYGNLGYGDLKEQSSPPAAGVNLGGAAKFIAAGGKETCAILVNGGVKCWGQGFVAGIPFDIYSERVTRPPATPLNLGSPAVHIAVGSGSSACAVLEDGGLTCWGSGDYGTLGYGDTSDKWVPNPGMRVNLGGAKAKQVAVGYFHTCVLLDTGAVKCWGQDGNGYLGYGRRGQILSPPADNVALGAPGKQIIASSGGTCVLLETGGIKCWGDARFTGRGLDVFSAPSSTPLALTGGMSAVSLGSVTSKPKQVCAVLEGGLLECWGSSLGYPEDYVPPEGWPLGIWSSWSVPPRIAMNLGGAVRVN